MELKRNFAPFSIVSRFPYGAREGSIVCLSVGLSSVGNVAAPDFLTASGITRGDLVGPDWSTTQLVGRAADWLGIAGMIVPSARHEDRNLVILVNRMAADDFYEISDEGGMLQT